MNYKLIHNLENLNKFMDLLPDLKENETYFLILIARKKWFPESIIPIACKLKRESVTKENMIRTIRQMEIEVGAYVTNEGVTIPQNNLGLYIAYNPKDQFKATSELAKKCLEYINNSKRNINIKSLANDVIQISNGSRNFIDIDVDVKDGEDYKVIVEYIKSIVNEKYLTFIKTNGGFHCLISLVKKGLEHCIGDDFEEIIIDTTKESDFSKVGKNWYQSLQKHPFKSELNIMNNDLMPLVGCNQGVFVPHFL